MKRFAAIAVLAALVLASGHDASAGPARKKVLTRSYEGPYASHVTTTPGEGVGPPSPRYEDRPSFPIPTWAKRARVTIADDAGMPVLATITMPGVSPNTHHFNTVCTSQPATFELHYAESKGVLRVAPDIGLWLDPNNCPEAMASLPTTGVVTVEFRS